MGDLAMEQTRLRFVVDFREKAERVVDKVEGMTLGELLYWVVVGLSDTAPG